jgi:plastocyanin
MNRSAVRIAALTAVLAVGAAAASEGAAAPSRAIKKHHAVKGKTRKVDVTSDFYDPTALTLHVGDSIKWVWHPTGFALHDVYVDSGPEMFNSPTQAAGSFVHRFKKAGRFKLYCTQHDSMTMSVTVKRTPK